MNQEPTTNGELNTMVDTHARDLAETIQEENLKQILSALATKLIHAHHINQHPCTNTPEDLRLLIQSGLRHLLWRAHEQIGNLTGAIQSVREEILEMRWQNNEEIRKKLVQQSIVPYSPAPEPEEIAA